MFGKIQKRREFKLRKHDEPPVRNKTDAENENQRHVHFESPDRSRYPRLLNHWPIFVIMGIIVLLAIFFLKWIYNTG